MSIIRDTATTRARRLGRLLMAPPVKLTSAERRAVVDLTEAQMAGLLANSRPFRKNGRVMWRVEAEVSAEQVQALLLALAEPQSESVE